MRNIPFDQYQRYKNTQKIINNIRKSGEKLRILEVGANAHKNLEKFLPNDDVMYLDITLPDELANDPQYILGDATQMLFKDNEFDIVVALDVYEHIPKSRREHFVNEVYRVCGKIAVIAAPFNKPEVVEAEIRANQYYKTISGKNHIWLCEHIDYGLPCLDEVKKFIENNNIDYTHFSHGSLENWEGLTNMHLATVVHNSLIDYKSEIDEYYNAFVFDYDYDKDGYRDFFVFFKEENLKIEVNYDNKKINKLKELEKNFYNLLSLTAIKEMKKDSNIIGKIHPVRLYVDYGEGFTEENSQIKYMESNKLETLVFDNLEEKMVKSIRIDPTETPGKFEIKELKVDVKNVEGTKETNIITNADLVDGGVYYFGKNDPQICCNVNSDVGSIKITIRKIVDYNTENDLKDEIIEKLKADIQNKNNVINELRDSQVNVSKKVKQMKNKLFSN